MNKKIDIPVLLVTFTRIETTLRVIDSIKKAGVKELYIFSDGPRNSSERQKVLQTRKAVINAIDWKCKVRTLFKKKNSGIKYYMYESLKWVFKENDYVIYLEDDTLPNKDFFTFQNKMLKKYLSDDRILGVSGYNFGYSPKSKFGYRFSRFGWMWGIGLYKRAFLIYQPDIDNYDQIRKDPNYTRRFLNRMIFFYLDSFLNAIYKKRLMAADFQMYYLAFLHNKYFIVSSKKLVENIGFNNNGNNPFIYTYPSRIDTIGKIIHPRKIALNKKMEKEFYKTLLIGGWPRLLAIRLYLNLPLKIQKIINLYLLKLLSLYRYITFQ